MKALVYHGPDNKAWEDVPDAAIQEPTDVVVKVDTTTICGTDLHILQGDVAAVTDGRILGHEAVGTVESVGSAVTTVRPGDRVLVILPRVPQWWTTMLALIRLGAVPIPGTHLLTPHDIAYRLGAAEICAVVTDTESATKFDAP